MYLLQSVPKNNWMCYKNTSENKYIMCVYLGMPLWTNEITIIFGMISKWIKIEARIIREI